MTHLTEEQLVDLYYEPSSSPAADSHLTSCCECRDSFAELKNTLDAFADLPIPEAPAFVWREPRLSAWKRWQPWVLIPALATALFGAFYIGRITTVPTRVPAPTIQLADSGRERILVVALGNHLQRSQMVLLELANGDPAAFPAAQERARNLIGETRLYHQNAVYSGDRNFSALLEELDRLLTAVANGQSQSLTPHAEQIEQLLFKIRVTDSNLDKGIEKL